MIKFALMGAFCALVFRDPGVAFAAMMSGSIMLLIFWPKPKARP